MREICITCQAVALDHTLNHIMAGPSHILNNMERGPRQPCKLKNLQHNISRLGDSFHCALYFAFRKMIIDCRILKSPASCIPLKLQLIAKTFVLSLKVETLAGDPTLFPGHRVPLLVSCFMVRRIRSLEGKSH